MRSNRRLLVLGVLFSFIVSSFAVVTASANSLPDPDMTPGLVCTEADPDFKEFDYPEQVARCKRNVKRSGKLKVAKDYGDIPEEDWSDYEFDHLIPLCAGGSNHLKNIWPQPLTQAKKKDVVENQVCRGLREGTMTQSEAIQKVHEWFESLKTKRGAAEQIFERALENLQEQML